MPIPQPNKNEEQQKFISRCMGDSVMNKDYTDQKQRAAVCYSTWKRAKKKSKGSVFAGDKEFLFDPQPLTDKEIQEIKDENKTK